jgi:type IV secretion system protein VirB3
MTPPADDKPQLTPLVIGLTRPPMMWGIPLNAFYIILGVMLIAFLVSASFWSAAIAPLAYIVLFSVCSRDPRILDILQVAARRTPAGPNKLFWRANSYGA